MWKKRNKTRQIKLILSNSLISPYILHTLEKNPLDQSHLLTRHRLTTTLYHFSLSFPLSIRSKFLTFPLISPRDSSTLTHDSIPIFLFSFLLRHYRPSSFLSHRLSTLVAIPRFHPRDNLSPRYTIYLRIRLSFFIIRLHPPLRLSLGAPFPLRISTLWNTTNNVSPTRHRVHVSTKVSGYLPPSWTSFGEKMSSVFVENNEFYSDSKMLLNFIKSFEELILYFFDAVSSQYSSSWRQKQWYTFILHNLWIKLLM